MKTKLRVCDDGGGGSGGTGSMAGIEGSGWRVHGMKIEKIPLQRTFDS